MDRLPAKHRRRTAPRILAAAAVLATASCSTVTGGTAAGTSALETASTAASPVTAEISQFRDNYSKQIIEIQLTNTTGAALTVLSAELTSPLFIAGITWPARTGGIELPPGQTKSLPVPLPAADCSRPPTTGATAVPATVSLRLAAPTGTAATGTAAAGAATTATAADPYGVLTRNSQEMCVARAAAAVAAIRLEPELEVTADAQTAVVRLLITPRAAAGAADPGTLTIDRIEGTTLIAEDPAIPWPHSVSISAGGDSQEIRLSIRPARCDPHAVAEDKVGTLLPLRVTVAGREGLLKIDAGATLRGRIYDFVTTACGRQ
ncbi:hypothetical protein [Pseudarthrobacter sp. S9]|uniref:hypothetical protein n=1 Tax=Pseudarthrobacter sp. S9 TaxID=3418421 RepID=UPI003D0752FC